MEPHVHHSVVPFYAHLVPMIYGVGMLIYAIPQQSKVKGSYLVRQEGNVMQFRKPLPMRRITLAAVGFLALLVLSLLISAPYARNPGQAFLPVVVGLGLPVLFLYLAGPDDIRLDGRQRTYERTVGWPWKPKTFAGPFNGVKGVCVSPRNSVLLLMEKSGPLTKGVVLSSSGPKAAAEALAEELKRGVRVCRSAVS